MGAGGRGEASRRRGVGALEAPARLLWLAVTLSAPVEEPSLGIGDWTGGWEGLTEGRLPGVTGGPKLGDVAL